jgi:hypothetical protein
MRRSIAIAVTTKMPTVSAVMELASPLTQGDAEAQCNLGGAYYYNGSRGLEKDEEKAVARAALLAIERACISGFYVLYKPKLCEISSARACCLFFFTVLQFF